MAFDATIWLSVVEVAPDERQVRAFWNCKENAVLDAVTDADRLWLGETRVVTPDEPRSPGSAGRVFDLLFLLGTIPIYQLPAITDELIEQVLEAFDAGAADGLPAASRTSVASFLQQRRGKFVAPDDVWAAKSSNEAPAVPGGR